MCLLNNQQEMTVEPRLFPVTVRQVGKGQNAIFGDTMNIFTKVSSIQKLSKM